jgi:hypothetical protein
MAVLGTKSWRKSDYVIARASHGKVVENRVARFFLAQQSETWENIPKCH